MSSGERLIGAAKGKQYRGLVPTPPPLSHVHAHLLPDVGDAADLADLAGPRDLPLKCVSQVCPGPPQHPLLGLVPHPLPPSRLRRGTAGRGLPHVRGAHVDLHPPDGAAHMSESRALMALWPVTPGFCLPQKARLQLQLQL
eukprot:CAMPEP_0174349710 /NCGR_PEP_ID=MMETSP0811_2-20130205/6512_1 /TAXON_ID=73025 ORGANISM="Eutreptiella gymnastica-like, Strain CCMP1594" /NCGR_SAMPLE_ID=MMETSP0811_2 /ASSEMBLY_ACC=CAM_ASM_000667 /LENGTH=140 /DNA_ID=CAMNT_0015477303 /DNA_START=146 /DNA_END=568 /DNA_ORIENTATION=-